MEKKAPFFLDKVFKRNPQTSKSSDERGWGNVTNNTTLNGWGSFPDSSSQSSTNGWVDEPHEKHYNGWGSGSSSSSKSKTPKASSNSWMAEPPEDKCNGWGSGSDTCLGTAEPPKDEYNGWGLGLSGKCTTPKASSNPWGSGVTGKCTTSIASSTTWMTNLSDSDTVQKTEIDTVNDDSWAGSLPVPSAPPLPDESLNNGSYNRLFDFIGPVDFFEKNEGKDVDKSGSSCVVCWAAPIECACVPCGHMAGCMACLYEINSKQGTCPVCRAKIDKVMRIYAI